MSSGPPSPPLRSCRRDSPSNFNWNPRYDSFSSSSERSNSVSSSIYSCDENLRPLKPTKKRVHWEDSPPSSFFDFDSDSEDSTKRSSKPKGLRRTYRKTPVYAHSATPATPSAPTVSPSTPNLRAAYQTAGNESPTRIRSFFSSRLSRSLRSSASSDRLSPPPSEVLERAADSAKIRRHSPPQKRVFAYGDGLTPSEMI